MVASVNKSLLNDQLNLCATELKCKLAENFPWNEDHLKKKGVCNQRIEKFRASYAHIFAPINRTGFSMDRLFKQQQEKQNSSKKKKDQIDA